MISRFITFARCNQRHIDEKVVRISLIIDYIYIYKRILNPMCIFMEPKIHIVGSTLTLPMYKFRFPN